MWRYLLIESSLTDLPNPRVQLVVGSGEQKLGFIEFLIIGSISGAAKLGIAEALDVSVHTVKNWVSAIAEEKPVKPTQIVVAKIKKLMHEHYKRRQNTIERLREQLYELKTDQCRMIDIFGPGLNNPLSLEQMTRVKYSPARIP